MAAVQRKLVHKQFNSPMGLYSQQNVKATLDRELKAFGADGIEVDGEIAAKPLNLANSAVLRAVEEEEQQIKCGYKRVAWPPVSEERIVREFTPQPVLQPNQQYFGQPVPQQQHQQQDHQQPQPHHQHQPQQQHQQQQPTQHKQPQQPQYRASSYDNYQQHSQSHHQPQQQHHQPTSYVEQPKKYYQPRQESPGWARNQQPIQLHPSQQPYVTQHQQQFENPSSNQQQHNQAQQHHHQQQQPQAYQCNSYSQPQQQQHQQQFEQPQHQQLQHYQQIYSQDQPDCQQQQQQQQYAPQLQRGTSPGMIQLRKETPISQKPTPVYTSQPAAVSYQGGAKLRGDLKWPPPEYKEAAARENEERRKIAMGPVCRPRKVHRDYTTFFSKNALSHHYPSYKVPPGTQHMY